MLIRPRVLQFGVKSAHQRLSDTLNGPQSEAKTTIGHVSEAPGTTSLYENWIVPVMTDLHRGKRRAALYPIILEARGGLRGGETGDTKPFSDLVFRDSALKYPRPIIKTSARRTRCCNSRDLAQTWAQLLLLKQTVADCPILHCFRCKSLGLEPSSRLPSCNRRLIRPCPLADRVRPQLAVLHEGFSHTFSARQAMRSHSTQTRGRLGSTWSPRGSRLSGLQQAGGESHTGLSRPHVSPGPRERIVEKGMMSDG